MTSEAAAPKKRRAASRKPASRRTTRKAAPRRRAAARKRAASRTSFEGVIKSITGGVAVARAAIAEASGQGVTAVRRVVGNASTASRKSITRLAKEWKAMDARKKASILAALLGAAAAASAPLVRSRWKKR
ncbi:MAG TPA: hypothetical protein VGL03_09145 [Thermoanaerobaculia bacterium]